MQAILKQIPTLLTNKYLELIILPTEQCNFRCTYCYEDFSIGKMSRPIIDGIKNLLTKRVPELDRLKISWFGGEPLAARDIVYEISEHILALTNNQSFVYLGNMTTNAFLLNLNVARKLIALGITDYQVSLDGTSALHDKTRLRIDGSGSFQQIWNNLLALKNSDLEFSILIRIHITPDNYSNIFDLIELLKLHFANDNRFKLFFKAIAKLGGPNSQSFTVLKREERNNAIEQLIAVVDNKIPIVSIKNTEVPYVCYAAQANSFVIRANGTLGKCTVALHSDRNSIGKITPDGTLEINQEKINPWLHGIKTLDTKLLQCPLYGIK